MLKVLLNGKVVPIQESTCNQLGWLQGNGIFETIKTVNSEPWALSRHMRRAVSSALKMGISMPSEEELRKGISELCALQPHDEGLLRLSFGSDGIWAGVHLEHHPVKKEAVLISYDKKVDRDGQSIKKYPYNHRLEILDFVRTLGADEAIVKNFQGKISEGAVTNLLFKLDGRWVTPPIGDGVLPGIMRALVIEYCGVIVSSIDIEQLPQIESAFLLSSLRIAQPVGSIDGRKLEQSLDFLQQIEAMALRTSVG